MNVYILFVLTSGVTATWMENTIVKVHQEAAKASNVTNCWVCSKKHTHSRSVPMLALPVYLKELNYTLLFSKNVTRENINKSVPLTIHETIGVPELCMGLSKLTKTEVSLGRSNCSQARYIVYVNGSTLLNNQLQVSCPNNGLESCNSLLEGSSFLAQNLAMWSFAALAAKSGKISITLQRGYYYVCGSNAFAWLPAHSRGLCYLARVVPAVGIVTNSTLKAQVQMPVSFSFYRKRDKRQLFLTQDKAWAWFPSWTGWGIELMSRLNNYTNIMDTIVNETENEIAILNAEVAQIRKIALQEKMALDYLLAEEGGMCAVVGQDCCTWITDSESIVQAHLLKVSQLQQEARSIAEEGWNPFKSLGGIWSSMGSWLSSVLQQIGMWILLLLIILLLIYISFKCIFYCCVRCLKTTENDYTTMSPHFPKKYLQPGAAIYFRK